MKHFSLLAVSVGLLSLTGCGSSELDFRNAQISNGKIYEGKENKPYTGLVRNMPESTIREATGALNDLLAIYNQHMGKFKASESLLYGRHLICDSEVKEGSLSGQTDCYTPNTKLKRYTVQYESGNFDGGVSIYAPDGKTLLLKSAFKRNAIDGKLEIYGPHTEKLIGQYHSTNGKADGDQTSWDEYTGKMTYQVTAKDGVYVGVMKSWTADGVLIAEVPFVEGVKSGLIKTWRDNGKPMEFLTVLNGSKNGPSQEWDEDGKLIRSGTYKQGEWYPDAPPVTETTIVGAEDNSCSTKWIDAFHKEKGEDAMITSSQLGEWDQWCTEGKLPD